MVRKLLSSLLLAFTILLPPAEAQEAGVLPAVEKFFVISRQFFKKHRGGALLGWFENYRDPNREKFGAYHVEIHRGFRFEFIRGGGFKEDTLTSITITDQSINLPLGL